MKVGQPGVFFIFIVGPSGSILYTNGENVGNIESS